MAFAAREWILRDYHSLIIKDLKFLTRKWINVILYHNIWRNRWNSKFLNDNIISKLPENVEIKRVPQNLDLYNEILSLKQEVDKLIILERQFLIWDNWDKINTISTNKLKSVIEDNDIHWLWIKNINFRRDLLQICKAIEIENIHRVHVLPWWKKHAIKHELFSLEWSWTLIWNDFWKPDIINPKSWDENIVLGVLDSNKWNKYLKYRSKKYVIENIWDFKVATIDDIPVWCVEIIELDDNTIELWALAVISTFLSLKIWLSLVEYVEEYAYLEWKDIISLTNNIKLQWIYKRMWFEQDSEWLYNQRSNESPWVELFILQNKNMVL